MWNHSCNNILYGGINTKRFKVCLCFRLPCTAGVRASCEWTMSIVQHDCCYCLLRQLLPLHLKYTITQSVSLQSCSIHWYYNFFNMEPHYFYFMLIKARFSFTHVQIIFLTHHMWCSLKHTQIKYYCTFLQFNNYIHVSSVFLLLETIPTLK